MPNGERNMSLKEPGIMFDATNSWNGYNHQGKIALWYAIGEIIKLIDPSISATLNRQVLLDYFLEIEHMEDFSVGRKVSGSFQYSSVHQVKDREDTTVHSYESALLGLAKHLVDDPTITGAYLHLTSEIDLKGQSLSTHLTSMLKSPNHLATIKSEILAKRNDPEYRNSFLISKRGRPKALKTELLHALSKAKPSDKKLTEYNLDDAFDQLLVEIDERTKHLQSLTPTQLGYINIYTYPINGTLQTYCAEDQAKVILKQQIKDFYGKLDPSSYKTGSFFVDQSYLFILGKLDQHIVDRALNYDAYKKLQLDRQISFTTIFDWLMSENIDPRDDQFYLYHVKEKIFSTADLYCKTCRKKGTPHCSDCQVPICKDKLGSLSFRQLHDFLRITNPHISGTLSMKTFADYSASPGINNPFFAGLRDIPQVFLQDQSTIAVSYHDFEKLQYALTAIAPKGTDDDNAIICSEIVRNRNVYSLLMDYDCLISKDISVDSIQDEEITQSHRYDPAMSDHIAHCKNVRIVPLTTFEASLSHEEENGDQ